MAGAPRPPAGGARNSQSTPARKLVASSDDASRRFTIRELADAYMAGYRGRDRSRAYNLGQWCDLIGGRVALDVDADLVADLIEQFRTEPSSRP